MNIRSNRVARPPRLMIIPMIDIIFFLMVFFLFSTLQMVYQKSMPVNLPVASSSHQEAPKPVAKRPAGNTYTISDDRDILEFYYNHKDDSVKDLVHAVCTNTSFWGQDLTQIAGFEDAVVQTLTEIEEKGTYEVMKECL